MHRQNIIAAGLLLVIGIAVVATGYANGVGPFAFFKTGSVFQFRLALSREGAGGQEQCDRREWD